MKTALRALERVDPEASGDALVADVRRVWGTQLGFDPVDVPEGREARERQATLSTLLAIVAELAREARAWPGSGHGGTRDACGAGAGQ